MGLGAAWARASPVTSPCGGGGAYSASLRACRRLSDSYGTPPAQILSDRSRLAHPWVLAFPWETASGFSRRSAIVRSPARRHNRATYPRFPMLMRRFSRFGATEPFISAPVLAAVPGCHLLPRIDSGGSRTVERSPPLLVAHLHSDARDGPDVRRAGCCGVGSRRVLAPIKALAAAS